MQQAAFMPVRARSKPKKPVLLCFEEDGDCFPCAEEDGGEQWFPGEGKGGLVAF